MYRRSSHYVPAGILRWHAKHPHTGDRIGKSVDAGRGTTCDIYIDGDWGLGHGTFYKEQ